MIARCWKKSLADVTVSLYDHVIFPRSSLVRWLSSGSVSLVLLGAALVSSPSSIHLLPSFVVTWTSRTYRNTS